MSIGLWIKIPEHIQSALNFYFLFIFLKIYVVFEPAKMHIDQLDMS